MDTATLNPVESGERPAEVVSRPAAPDVGGNARTIVRDVFRCVGIQNQAFVDTNGGAVVRAVSVVAVGSSSGKVGSRVSADTFANACNELRESMEHWYDLLAPSLAGRKKVIWGSLLQRAVLQVINEGDFATLEIGDAPEPFLEAVAGALPATTPRTQMGTMPAQAIVDQQLFVSGMRRRVSSVATRLLAACRLL